MFGFLFRNKEKVYCQNCKTDLTDKGGYVTSDGDIYCIHEEMVIFLPRSMKDKNFFVDYKTPKEIQQLIKENRLTHYKKLTTILKLENILEDD